MSETHDPAELEALLEQARQEGYDQALRDAVAMQEGAWSVLDWLAENNPAALELCPYKAKR